jgi:hypothetical protein
MHGAGLEPANALSGRVLNPVGLTTPQPVLLFKKIVFHTTLVLY